MVIGFKAWVFCFFILSQDIVYGHDDFSKIIKKITPSLVMVRSQVAHNQPSPHFDIVSGTGMIVSKDGYILTNAHLVTHQQSFERFNKTEVLLYQREYIETKVVGVDP